MKRHVPNRAVGGVRSKEPADARLRRRAEGSHDGAGADGGDGGEGKARALSSLAWSRRAERRIAQELGFRKEDVREVVEAYLRQVFKELLEEGVVRVQHLGLFRLKKTQYEKPVFVCWAPVQSKGKRQRIQVNSRYNVYFSLSDDLKKFLKEKDP